MWARGLEERPVTVRFDAPAGCDCRVATQLLRAATRSRSGANLQYLMDTPPSSRLQLRTFTIADAPGRRSCPGAPHGTARSSTPLPATSNESSGKRGACTRVSAFEGNTYTFIADYLPWASGDAWSIATARF